MPQSISISLNEPLDANNLKQSSLAVKFQGGFVGSVCHLTLENSEGEAVHNASFYPDDINDRQVFPLIDPSRSDAEDNECKNVVKIRILFEKSTDFFGRIIIYNLEFLC